MVDWRVSWVTSAARSIHGLGYTWAVPVVGWTTIALLLAAKRLRHLFVYFGSLVVASTLVAGVALQVGRQRPWGVEQLAEWVGFAHPSLPVTQLSAAVIGAAYALVPRDQGRRYFVAAGTVAVALFGLSRIYLGVEYPTDAAWGWVQGTAITVTAFLVLCPEKVFPVGFQRGRAAHLDIGGPRGKAIQDAVSHQLGIEVETVEPFGLADSAGSTPMLLTTVGGASRRLFAKLYARSHLRSDRWYKLGRTLLYGRLEDEGRFTNVRRLVEREDYLLRVMRDAGVRAPDPHGIVTITPEREYLIVTEFLDGAEELTGAEIDDDLIDDALGLVRTMWDHGLAHRDIKPSNVMIRDGEAFVIDVAFGQMRPSAWREAVDLANMMLCLGLRSSSERVYERALRLFTADEIAEAFAAARGITLPSQLRRELKTEGRDLMDEFRELGPARRLMPIQRWSVRRVGLALWVATLAAGGLVLGLGNLPGIGLL
jgi:tRNA A-37 threonylcarbamoyl transferase component Bud32